MVRTHISLDRPPFKSRQARYVWKRESVASQISDLVRGKAVCDPFLGPGGLAFFLSPFASHYWGCETSGEMLRDFSLLQRAAVHTRKVKAYRVDGFKFSMAATFDIAVLDPPWGGYQVFLGKRYILLRRHRKVVELALHILRSGSEVVFVLPFHTVIPPRLERWKFFESEVIKKDGRDYCKVWAFRR
jgi:tRNA G10  N-methylase Trm11